MFRQELNNGWSVSARGSMFERGSAQASVVDLPHDAMLAGGRSEDGVAHLGYYRDGTWQYTKSLDVPADWSSRRVTLEFEGAYRDAMVFINGAFAGQCANGYVPFYVPIDPYLSYGGKNDILVEVQVHDDSRWYSGGGIYRPVNLLLGDLVHIPPTGIRVRTPQVDDEIATVEVTAEVVNASPVTQRVRAVLEVRDLNGAIVASDAKPITVIAGEKAILRHRCYVRKPDLWSAENPSLYTATVLLDTPDGQHDKADATFGIRTISFDPVHGLRINGQPVKLRGASLHHDHGILGTAEFDRSAERRIAVLKAAGFNAIRSAAHPASRAILDAADRLGMYVLDESWDMWHMSKTIDDYSRRFEKWWREDIDAIVAKNFNHPSVVGYGIGCEIIEIGTRHGARLSRLIAERVREQDPSRFITNSTNAVMNMWVNVPDEPVVSFEGFAPAAPADSDVDGGTPAESAPQPASPAGDAEAAETDNSFNAAAQFMEAVSVLPSVAQRLEESAGTLDVFGLNYGHVRFAVDKDEFPNRVLLNSETFPAKIAQSWGTVLAHPQVIGDFTWVGWDYLGEPGVGRPIYPGEPSTFTAPWPWLTGNCSDIDLIGQRLPVSYYREIVFGLRQGPYLVIQNPARRDHPARPVAWAWSDTLASWSWDMEEGSIITAEAYADADEIAFLVNGAEAARAAVGEELPFVATADIPYHRGSVEAVAFKNGAEIGRFSLQTAGQVTQIGLTADKDRMKADTQDLIYVDISLVDDNGNLHPGFDAEVTVTVEGPAALQGLGSARPLTKETTPFLGNSCTTFRGRALAAIRYSAVEQEPGNQGSVTVTVKSAELPSSTVTLPVVLERAALPDPA